MTETVFANAKIITENAIIQGTLMFADGVIRSIDSGRSVPSGAIDCEGDYVAPGLIELHTDNLERHLTPRPKVNWPKLAAVLGPAPEPSGAGLKSIFLAP